MAITDSQNNAAENPTTPTRDQPAVRCQVATTWSADSSAWSWVPTWDPIAAAQGWGGAIGTAVIRQRYGVQNRPGWDTTISLPPGIDDRRNGHAVPILGKYVRLLLRLPEGQAERAGDVPFAKASWRAFWWGVIVETDDEPDGVSTRDVGGTLTIRAEELLGVLAQIRPAYGYETGDQNWTGDPGRLLVFNGDDEVQTLGPVGNRGDFGRCVVPDGGLSEAMGQGTTWAFRRSKGELWTAYQAVHHLLTCYANHSQSKLLWSVAAEGGADITRMLGYSEEWDVGGWDILRALRRIINSRRGVGFRLGVDNGMPQIVVQRMGSVQVSAGGIAIPGNSAVVSLDLRGAAWLGSVKVSEDGQHLCDDVRCEGDPEAYVATFTIDVRGGTRKTDFTKGWRAPIAAEDREPAWDAANGRERRAPKFDHVWREFALRPDWDGAPVVSGRKFEFARQEVGGDAPRNDEQAQALSLHGVGGENGECLPFPSRQPNWSGLRFLRMLPIPAGYDITTMSAGDIAQMDRARPLIAPMLFYSTDGANWRDVSSDFELTVVEQRASVLIGRPSGEDATRVRSMLLQGSFRLTIAMQSPLSLRVGWMRAGALPRDRRRGPVVIPCRRRTRHRIWPQTMLHIDKNGKPKVVADLVVLRDDTNELKKILALAKDWYTNPRRTVSWSVRGLIDTDITPGTSFHPGALVDKVVRGDKEMTIGANVVRRSWDFVRTVTSYDTDIPAQDLDPVTTS